MSRSPNYDPPLRKRSVTDLQPSLVRNGTTRSHQDRLRIYERGPSTQQVLDERLRVYRESETPARSKQEAHASTGASRTPTPLCKLKTPTRGGCTRR